MTTKLWHVLNFGSLPKVGQWLNSVEGAEPVKLHSLLRASASEWIVVASTQGVPAAERTEAEGALDRIQVVLKNHGLLRPLIGDINCVRQRLGFPPIDRDGYVKEEDETDVRDRDNQ